MKQLKVRKLKELIADSFDYNFEIIEEKTRMLTAPGEHYGSIMLAIDLKIKMGDKEKTLNLVAKLIPASEMLRQAFDIQVTVRKEVSAYLQAIPALINLQKEYHVPKEKIIDIFPKCYGARLNLDKGNLVDDDSVLIFENLKTQGYGMGDRFKGFDLAHSKMIVKDLGQLHALPIALRNLKPKLFESEVMPCLIQNYGLDRLPTDVRGAFVDSIVVVGRTIPELVPYVDKMEQMVEQGFINMGKPRPPPTEAFGTIVHADYWVNNTMILWDKNGNPLKNKMVDLQIMAYASGIHDLLFFIFTSTEPHILENHYDELIKDYYDSFTDNLKDFNIDMTPYEWNAFLQEIEKVGPMEWMHIVFMLKPIFTEKGKVNSLDEFQPSDWSRRDLLGPAHAKKLKEVMLAYIKRNWV